MANGLLGKKVVSSRDTELLYTVPSAKVATFNVNILNDGGDAADINLYVSDKTYQTKDFEDYLTPLNYSKSWNATDTGNTLDLVGKSSSKMMTALKTTPVQPAAANTASQPIASKKIETLQTANNDGNFFLVTDPAAVGNPLSYYNGGELYVRAAPDGGVYTFNNLFSGGSATTSASNYGFTATDNILWATNVDSSFAIAYVQGVPGAAGTIVNSIADYRATTASYNSSFTWGFGSINKIVGVKTSAERFIIGNLVGAFCYVSNDDTPETQAEFQSNSLPPPTGITGPLMGAVGIEGSTTNEGNLYLVYQNSDITSGGKVAYVAYDASTPVPLTGYSTFDFPAGVNAENVIDVKAEGDSLVLVVEGGQKYATSNLGVSWSNSKHYAGQPIGIQVASINSQNKFVNDVATSVVTEMTFIRGRTYRIHQEHASNNGHPLQFSTVSGGPHSNGTPYSDGMTFYMGDPTATAAFTAVTTTNADWVSNHATYNGQAKIIEWTVPSNAPDTLYLYCPNHTGMGYAVSVVDEDTTDPHDDATALATVEVYNADNGDANRRYDLFFNGESYMREKRFFALPQQDKFEKTNLASGEILERTALMASAGEQVIVTSDKDNIVVRIHGIEE